MMMCNMKYGVFVFFGVWQTGALIFTALLVPETRGVPIEKVLVPELFLRHICFYKCVQGRLCQELASEETVPSSFNIRSHRSV